MLIAAFAVLIFMAYATRPTADAFRLRARRTGTLLPRDYIAHAVAVQRRHAAIVRTRRDFRRRLRAHLTHCEDGWREQGWRGARDEREALAFIPYKL